MKKEKEDELQKELEMIQGEDEQLQQVEDSFGVFTDKYPIIVELGLDLAALVKQKINGKQLVIKLFL